MRYLSTIFVIAMTLSACTGKPDNSGTNDLNRKAIGMESKTGRALTAKELCTEVKTDASTGQSTVDTLLFNSNSTYVKRTLMIDSQVQFVPVSTTKGYWGLFNDTLLLNDKGVQSRLAIKAVEGDNRIVCYEIGNPDALQTYCPCN
jgi:hypothetical protein